jgi:transposase, IS5 family
VEGGILTGSRIVEQGGGPDEPNLKDSLQAHRRHFGRAPDLLAADRGMSSAANERLARRSGVRQVAIPDAGRASPRRQRDEKARGIRRGNRFRAGIEGRVHVPRRDFGLERSRYLGGRGMGRWVVGGS